MPPEFKTTSVKLYAPSIDKSIKNFELKQSTTFAAVLERLRTALGDVSQAWPYNARRAPIMDFITVKEGQNLLIATDYFEEPLTEKIKDVLIVQPGSAETAWMALSPAQKYTHIMYLRHSSLSATPPIYLSLPLTTVQTLIRKSTVKPSSSSSALASIEENWNLPIDAVLGFQGLVMPYGEIESWDKTLLSTLAVLSAATVAQGHVIGKLIIKTVEGRGGNVVEVADVLEVGRELYRRAVV